MTEEQAMKWARETATEFARMADHGDPQAKLSLDLMAQSYLVGWLKRDNACKQGEINRLLAANGEEC